MKTPSFLTFFLAWLLATLGGCSLIPEYVRPVPPVPESVHSGDSGDSVSRYEAVAWDMFFSEPRLQALIRIGLENNRDLRIAAIAVSQAAATHRLQRAEQYPQMDAGGGSGYSGDFRGNDAETYEASAEVGFILDVFGRLASQSTAARETWLATAEAEKAVRVALIAEIAKAYVNETFTLERRDLAAVDRESRKRSRTFIESRLVSGQSSLLELEQATSLVEAASAILAEREREVVLAQNALRLLLGSHDLPELPQRTSLDRIGFGLLPSGVPSSVMLTRPDVMEAEHTLRAANADIGAARAAFFPSITLTGGAGYMSDDLAGLFTGASGFWSFLPRISVPLFTGGRNKANLDLAELRRESAVAGYEKTIQAAFREVADALQTRDSYDRQIQAQERYLASQHRVEQLALSRYTNGTVSYLEVLDAQRAVFEARQDLAAMRKDRLVNDITVYAALGGGGIGPNTMHPPMQPKNLMELP